MIPKTLLLALTLSLQAQVPPLAARLAAAEAVMAVHFRGEPLDVARSQSNAAIEAFNARTGAAKVALDAAKADLDRQTVQDREAQAGLREQIRVLDATLKQIPDGNDKAGNTRYQAHIQERKALMQKTNDLVDRENARVDAYNTQVRQVQEELNAQRTRVRAQREAVDQRVAAYEAFARNGGDLAFFTQLNRLLLEARQGGDSTALAQARALRRELGTWAAALEARNPHGTMILEARVGDEPVWLVLDTGASDVVVAPEVLEAAGVSLVSGEDNTVVVVGGQRLRAREVRLSRIAAAGQTLADVPATAMRPCQLGVDGLLGQSFLRGFTYTVDTGKAEPLALVKKN